MIKRDKNFHPFLLGILFFANILAWIVVYDLSRPHFLEVDFFDIGQGDAIFIETPQRHQILIDGGPGSIVLEKLGQEIPFWDRTIDLIILTHPEQDHLTGLLEVLKKYKIENILWTGVKRDTSDFKEWKSLIEKEKKEGARIKIAQAGQKIKLHGLDPCNLQGSDPCLFMEVLYPLENLEGQEFKNSNDTSIVSRLVFKENSFLFTGDTYKSAENKLIIRENSHSNSQKFASLNSDVLKVGHHGSKTSSSEEFIEKVSPEIAIISVGANKEAKTPDCDNKERNIYGHPNCEVLERLKKYGIKILRTDKDGDIKIISDGINLKYEVSNF